MDDLLIVALAVVAIVAVVSMVLSSRRARVRPATDQTPTAAAERLLHGPLLRIEIPEYQEPNDLRQSETLGLSLPADLANRVDRVYETALGRALGELGEVRDSEALPKMDEEGFHLELQILLIVSDLDQSLPIIRRVLREHGAPEDTKIRQYSPTELVFGLDEDS